MRRALFVAGLLSLGSAASGQPFVFTKIVDTQTQVPGTTRAFGSEPKAYAVSDGHVVFVGGPQMGVGGGLFSGSGGALSVVADV